jgi:hypothetical protein
LFTIDSLPTTALAIACGYLVHIGDSDHYSIGSRQPTVTVNWKVSVSPESPTSCAEKVGRSAEGSERVTVVPIAYVQR